MRFLIFLSGLLILLGYSQFFYASRSGIITETVIQQALMQWQNLLASLLFAALGWILGRCYLGSWLAALLFALCGSYISIDMIGIPFFDGHIPYSRWGEIRESVYLSSSISEYLEAQLIPSLALTLAGTLLLLPPIINRLEQHITLPALGTKTGLLALTYLIASFSYDLSLADNQHRSDNAFGALIRQLLQSPLQESHIVDLTKLRYAEPDLPVEHQQHLAMAAEQIKQSAQPLNLILIVLESVGSHDLIRSGELSEQLTPNLFKLSQHGVLFDSLYVSVNSSEHQNLAIMTGGFQPTWEPPRDLLHSPYLGRVLGRELQRQDYQTALFAGTDLNFRNMRQFTINAGYDYHYDFSDLPPESQDNNRVNSWGGDDRHFLQQAGQWSAQTKNPWFLHYISNAPHDPYNLPKDAPTFTQREPNNTSSTKEDNYLSSLQFIDHAIGLLLNNLKKANQLNQTLIAVTGDHPSLRKGLSERALKSFLLLSAPGQLNQPTRSDRVISHDDLMPTLLALLNKPVPEGLLGQNIFGQQYQPKIRYFHDGHQPHYWGLIDGPWKYIATGIDRPAQLFNLTRSEVQPVLPIDPNQIALYSELVETWYLRQNRLFTDQLSGYQTINPLINSITDIDKSGPTAIRFGHLQQDEFKQGSPIRLQPEQLFHPQSEVSAWFSWINPSESQSVELIWIDPTGHPYRQLTQVKPDSSIIHARLNQISPLLLGDWRLQVMSNGILMTEGTFEVTEQAPLHRPTPLNRLYEVRIGEVKLDQEDFVPKFSIQPSQPFSIQTQWQQEDLAHQYTLELIPPRGDRIRFPLPLPAKWSVHIKTLTPPSPLPEGEWLLAVYDGELLLGQTPFEVTAQPTSSSRLGAQ